MARIHFPQFGEREYSPFEMRQLIQALELRFQGLEQADTTTEEYAVVGHTHEPSEVGSISSIFELDDVAGTPELNDSLVWDGSAFVPSEAVAADTKLNDLLDVNAPGPTNGQTLNWDQSTLRWVAGDFPDGVDTLFELTDTNLLSDGSESNQLLYTADGFNWEPSGASLQWDGSTSLRLGDGVSVNWLDSTASSSRELITHSGTADAASGDIVLFIDAESASNGATSVTSSVGGHTFNAIDNGTGLAEVSSLQAKFGSLSLRCDDEAGAVAAYWKPAAASDDFFFGSGDWTVEFHWRQVAANGTTRNQIGRFPDTGGDRAWDISINGNSVGDYRTVVNLSSDGTTLFSGSGGQAHWSTGATNDGGNINKWYHIAVSRVGNSLYIFTDGDLIGTYTITGFTMFTPVTKEMYIGDSKDLPLSAGPTQETFYDNIRITKGTGRYTTDFTPPAAPYSSTGAFIVGDPASSIQIDGSSALVDTSLTVTDFTQLNSTLDVVGATQLDSTLNVDGFGTFNAGVKAFSYVADTTTPILTLATDANNAERRLINFWENDVNGFYLQGKWTPNTPDNLLTWGSDKPSGSDRIFEIGERGEFAFDSAAIDYDAAGNLIMTGVTTLEAGDRSTAGTVRMDLLPAASGNAILGFFEGAVSPYFKNYGVSFEYDGVADSLYVKGHSNHSPVTETDAIVIPRTGAYVDIRTDLRASNSTGANYASFIGGATDFSTTFTNQADWDITGLTGEMFVDADIRTSGDVLINPPAASNAVLRFDNPDASINAAFIQDDAGNLVFRPDDADPGFDEDFYWLEASSIWVFEPDVRFDSNITFDAVTNTIAGIQNQNLLDKTANESVTGEWEFIGSGGNGGIHVQGNLQDNGIVGQFVFMDVASGIGRFGSYDWDAGAWKDCDFIGNNVDLNGIVSVDLQISGTTYASLDNSANFVLNSGAIGTTATDGFLYVASCAGTPTGTPTTKTGRVPIVVDSTNNKLYFYSGGSWRDAGP